MIVKSVFIHYLFESLSPDIKTSSQISCICLKNSGIKEGLNTASLQDSEEYANISPNYATTNNNVYRQPNHTPNY